MSPVKDEESIHRGLVPMRASSKTLFSYQITGVTKLALITILSAAILPNSIIGTNDSLSYLSHAAHGSIDWPIYFGFKQPGYTIYLSFLACISHVTHLDFLKLYWLTGFTLLVTVCYTCSSNRAVNVFITVVTIIALTRVVFPFLLPEHLLVSLMLALGCATAKLSQDRKSEHAKITFCLCCLIIVVAANTKISSLVLALPFSIIGSVMVLDELRKGRYVLLFVASTGFLLIVAQLSVSSKINGQEYGTASPVANTARITLWGLDHYLRSNDMMEKVHESEVYSGSVYNLIHSVEASAPATEASAQLNLKIRELMEITNVTSLQIASQQFYSAFLDPQGFNDIRGTLERSVQDEFHARLQMHWAMPKRNIETSRFLDNELSGENIWIHRAIYPLLLLSIFVAGALALTRQPSNVSRIMVVATALSAIALISMLSLQFIANFRYTIPAFALMAGMNFAMLSEPNQN